MKPFRFVLYFIPVVWSLIRDLLWEEVPLEVIKVNYLFGKANAFERAAMVNQAIRVYEQIMTKDPKRTSAFLNLAGLYYRIGRYESAIPCYLKVIKNSPRHYQAHYWLARCYFKLRRYYAAINTLEEVISYIPTFKDALNLMGECYERVGDVNKAEHFYLKAIGADPGGKILPGFLIKQLGTESKAEERIKN